MAEINRPPNPNPYWPWGANRLVREKIVQLEQLERKQRAKRKGDPKNPPLASAALLEFMGPGHTSEELRLPEPQVPVEMQAELGGEVGLSVLRSIKDRTETDQRQKLERGLTQVKATPERVERLRSLMRCETDMLGLMGNLHDAVAEIERMRRIETKDEGF